MTLTELIHTEKNQLKSAKSVVICFTIAVRSVDADRLRCAENDILIMTIPIEIYYTETEPQCREMTFRSSSLKSVIVQMPVECL